MTQHSPGLTLQTPTKTGYAFNGWYSEFGYLNLVTGFGTTDAGAKTVFAKWTANTYDITYVML